MDFKVPEDILTNRNGKVLNIQMDNNLIGMPNQKFNPWEPASTGEEMRTGPSSGRIFQDGSDKSDGAGTINKNGEYGPITYGF